MTAILLIIIAVELVILFNWPPVKDFKPYEHD